MLADKANRCAASIHRHQQLLPVFAATADDTEDNEEQSDFTFAAVGSSRGGRFNQAAPEAAEAAGGPSPAAALPSQAQQAKQAGLCRNYFIYGKKTYNCGGTCSWTGN